MKENDLFNCDEPTCPVCRAVDYDWWENSELDGDGDTSIVECPNCETTYKIIMGVYVDFDCHLIERGNIK